MPHTQKLYFCEYDLAFFKQRHQMLRHLRKVKLLHPPGTEIYRNGNISMFEVRAGVGLKEVSLLASACADASKHRHKQQQRNALPPVSLLSLARSLARSLAHL